MKERVKKETQRDSKTRGKGKESHNKPIGCCASRAYAQGTEEEGEVFHWGNILLKNVLCYSEEYRHCSLIASFPRL